MPRCFSSSRSAGLGGCSSGNAVSTGHTMRLQQVVMIALLLSPRWRRRRRSLALPKTASRSGRRDGTLRLECRLSRRRRLRGSVHPGCRHRLERHAHQRARRNPESRHRSRRRQEKNRGEGAAGRQALSRDQQPRISFPKPGEALYPVDNKQTMRKDEKDGRMVTGSMGRSEDHLVKRDGKWLIEFRKLTVFTE